jgi:hypothetical protein
MFFYPSRFLKYRYGSNPNLIWGMSEKTYLLYKANKSTNLKDKNFGQNLYTSENVLRRAQASFLLDVRPHWLGLFQSINRDH